MEPTEDSALPAQFTWSGSRSSHGIDYEKDLAFTLFVAASSEERQFRLATEMNVAGKFDDAVLILDDRKEVWLFQAKHSQTSNAKIEYNEFFPSSLEENSQFSLPMYIQSFRNVSEHSEFKNYKKRFIIFSNKSIDENTRNELGKFMDINNCALHDPLEEKVFTKSSEQFVPKAEQIQDLLNKLNELPVAIRDAIIELQKSGTVKSILRKYTTPLRFILEIDGSVRFSETFTGSEDNINQQWLWNELQRHFITQIGTIERLSEVVFNKKIDKRQLQNKSAETSFPRFIEESDLRHFFDCLVMCTDQPDELFRLRDNTIESIVKKWIHEKDRGLFKDRTKFHVIFEKAFGDWHMVTNLNGNQKPFLSSNEGNLCIQKTRAELRRSLQNITDADFSNYVERRVVFQNEEIDFTEEKFTSMLEQSSDRTDYYILIGKPGMGKTTFMKKITHLLQADFNKHVYLICLSRLFNNYKEGNVSIFKLLKSAFSQSIQQLVQNSLEHFHQQCFILFDGFDEVDACHQDSAIKLIKETFCKNKICVFISGRNHVKERLEEALQVKSLDLVPLLEDEQLSFLRNFWDISSEIDEEDFDRFQRFAKRLLEILHDNIKTAYFRFTGLPLMVRMLAEVYKEKFEEYWSSTNENITEILSSEDKLSLLSLYSNFVNISFNMFVRKINKEEAYATVDLKVVTFFKDNFKSFYHAHQLIAIKQLRIAKLQHYLKSDHSVSLLENMQKILDCCEKSLLIDVSSKNQLQFTHLSYAEYFLANFLYEHVSECEASLAITLASYEVVRTCFFSMIRENWDDSSLQLNTIIEICHKIPEILYCACSDGDELILRELLKHHKAKEKFSSYYLIGGGTLLHAAVKSKKENILKLVLCEYQFGDCSHHEAKSDIVETYEKVVDINTPDSRGMSPIHYAVSYGNKAFVKTLAQHGAHKIINAQDIKGNTLLHIAARVGDSEMIKMLADFSANPKIRDHEGRTILHVAAAQRDLMIVKLMITEFSCDCNAQDNYGYTPLHSAATSSTKEMVKMMIDQYTADYQIVNEEGRTVIHFAAKGSNIDVVRMLIDDYAIDINAQDYDGNTPILLAAEHSTREMVKMLIDQYSADYQIVNEDGRTLIHTAVKGDKMYIVKMLLDDYKLNVNAQDYDGNTPLHIAAEFGTKEMVKMLIDQYHADLKIANDFGGSPIHAAARKNNLDVVRMLIEDYMIDVNIKCDDGNTPLLYAASFDEWEMFKILINEYDAVCKIANKYGQTVVHVAAKNGNMEILEMLIENYAADVNVRDFDGNTPLHLAAMDRRWEMSCWIIKKYSADCKLANNKGQTLIHLAVSTGNMDIVKMLINDYAADINVQDNDGISPLHLAVQYSTRHMVKILINRYTADYKTVSKYGHNLIHSAAKGFNKEMVEMLINDYAADVNARDVDGNTPLHIAARHSTCALVMMLISKYSADHKTTNGYGKSPIHLAVEGDDMETVKMLLDVYGTDVNAQDNDGNAPVHLAAEYSTLEMVMMLINEYLANYKMANKYGKTLIHFAASGGNLETIKMLIEDFKADVNAQDNDGNTPLYLAAEFSSWRLIKKLIDEHLADYKIANKYGQMLIHVAVEGGNKRTVKMLLDDYEENVNAQDNDGNTPLHLAVKNSIEVEEGNLEIVKMLIEDYAADVNAQDNDGNTPLHCAATQGDRKNVKMLIDNNRANFSLSNRIGHRLLHCAARSGQWDVVDMLLVDYSLDVNTPDGSGCTLLHLACELNNLEAVKMLINDHSADINRVDNEGRTPSQVAAERGHWNVVNVVDELAGESISSLQE